MMLEATSNASALMLDSRSIGKGACFAIGLSSKAECELTSGKAVTSKGIPSVAKRCVADVLKFFKKTRGVRVQLESNIPKNSGLGFEESAACSTAIGLIGALAKEYGAVYDFKIDKYMREQFYVIDDKIVDRLTIARLLSKSGLDFARLCCSLFGGFFITDNTLLEILRRGENEDFSVVACTLKKYDKSKLYKREVQLAYDEALKGNLYSAMNLNALLHSSEAVRAVIAKMLEAGALTTTCSGSSVVALVRDPKKNDKVITAAKKYGDVLLDLTSNNQARVFMKPKKIVKVAEFLEIKGDADYYFL